MSIGTAQQAMGIGAAAEAAGELERREFLTCRLGEEAYGIDILQVQEIREIDHVTRVPHVAAFVRGVINLRGAIVPVVDLGLMFGFAQPIALKGASVIVLNAERRLVGLAVSGVSDVIALATEEILPAPDLGDRAIGAAIEGIGRRDGASVMLLDVGHVLRRVRAVKP
ncbi:MAG: purine-binding chemotaxis protein CheW [Betaproteobacteria bacterium]|nr:purine-binding chemotaxis protein CheW [Betaproteobacteria bacterium]